MQIEPISAFDDNYIWLLTEADNQYCAVVDPGDEEPVREVLTQKGLSLSAILITHKHYDHVGGVDALKEIYPGAIVFGPGNEGIRQVEHVVEGGGRARIPGMQLVFDVLSVPGHTEGHVAYYGEGALFCGDTLFSAGCGRVFTGTFSQMTASLKKIRELPSDTLVYCAHEYTEANIGFASWVEPNNQALKMRAQQVSRLRSDGLPTVPSTLEMERQTNPFLRLAESDVIAAAVQWSGKDLTTDTEVFTALRQWKDREYD